MNRKTNRMVCNPLPLLTTLAFLAAAPWATAQDVDPTTDAQNTLDHFSPPMGWNSYTGYSIAVTEQELIKNIDVLSEKLLPFGYDPVTGDNGWFLSGKGDGITMNTSFQTG